MAKLTKTIETVKSNGYTQEVQIDVEFKDNEVIEVIEVTAFNFINGVFNSAVSIKDFLESQNLMDVLLASINWSEIYADAKHELTHA